MLSIGFLGCGKMGSALARGIEASFGAGKVRFFLHDALPAAAQALATSLKQAEVCKNGAAVAAASEVVILAVKPGDMAALAGSLSKLRGQRLYVSIAAGIKLQSLQQMLGSRQRVIRCMPNTPALVGAGASAFACGKNATKADAQLAQQLLGAVGLVEEVPEKLLDAVTGLSGSGPAYGFTVIEAMADGGVLMGLPRATALRLAAQTLLGAAKLVLDSSRHPAVLRDEVASPGGTTIAGINALEEGGLRKAVIAAVRRATERSQELG